MRHPSRGARAGALAGLAVFAWTLATLSPAHAAAKPTPELAREIDRLLTAAYPAAEPGAAVLVSRGGEVVLRKGYGMANVELRVPITPESVFEIGSITKQFTAAAVLLLAERGKLRLDDDVTKILPDYPKHAPPITIEHLLTHTSGLPDYTQMPEWAARMKDDIPLSELVAFFKDKPLDFAPGTRWRYSNSGYAVLGAVIEKASGTPYSKFVEEEVLKPCGMKSSRYGSLVEIVPHRASGYEGDASAYRNADYLSMTQPYAAGALQSTVDDLAAWELAQGKLLKQGSLDRMRTSYVLPGGTASRYGYGLGVGELGGRRIFEHNGGINGFASDLLLVPDEKLTVVVLSNNPGHTPSPGPLAHQIAKLVLGQPTNPAAVPLAAAALPDYTGVFVDADKTVRRVTEDGGHLYAARGGNPKTELIPIAPDRFAYRDSDSLLRFVRGGDRKVTGAFLDNGFGPEIEMQRGTEPVAAPTKAVEIDPAVFDRYVGTYELKPGFAIAISRDGGRYYAQATGQPRAELVPESETSFAVQEVEAKIEFVRGADGKAQLILHQGGHDMPGRRVG